MATTNQHGIKSNFLSHVLSSKSAGTVHSVFNNSFNLVFQEQLVHIGKEREGVSAFGMTLAEHQVDEMLAALTVGNRVLWRDEVFTFYTRQKVFTLDTRQFKVVDCHVPKLDYLPDLMAEKMRLLSFAEKTDFFLSERNRILVEKFVRADFGDRAFQETFIHHFIGRGQGLTPSGDDMLMGILLAIQAFEGNNEWVSLLKEQLKLVETTQVSDAYYQALLEGYTSSHFISLFQAVKDGEWEKWDALIKDISNYGHSSGWDTLFGLSLYIDNHKGDNH